MDRIARLRDMLAAQPTDSFLQHALALEYIKLGNDEEALKLFIALLRNEPDYVGSYYHLGKLYERLGRSEDAIESYEQGIAVAAKLKDNHARIELQQALNELTDNDDD